MSRRATQDYNLAVLYPELAASLAEPSMANTVTPGLHVKLLWCCGRGHQWQATIGNRIRSNGCPYCGRQRTSSDYNLAVLYPELAASLVEPILAYTLTPGSHTKPWWQCVGGHKWQAEVNSRVKGNGCPYCPNDRVSPEHNLEVAYPVVAREWSGRNEKSARQYSPQAQVKVWWLCDKGHEWRALISNRARGSGCPYCSGRFPAPDHNLAVLHPELALEWSWRNTKTTYQYTPGSGIKVWWCCSQGHEWQSTIPNRLAGNRCPYCAGRQPTLERNLEAIYPLLAKEWSSRNQRPARDFTPGSRQKAWWRCARGHEWQAQIKGRTKRSQGCPRCSRVTPEHNLAAKFPELVPEWSDRNARPASD